LEHIRHARVMHLYLLDVVDYHHPPILRDTRTIRRYVICQNAYIWRYRRLIEFVAAVGLTIVVALYYCETESCAIHSYLLEETQLLEWHGQLQSSDGLVQTYQSMMPYYTMNDFTWYNRPCQHESRWTRSGIGFWHLPQFARPLVYFGKITLSHAFCLHEHLRYFRFEHHSEKSCILPRVHSRNSRRARLLSG
jgi:hypothetical protein